jgi:hypothetical protein
MRTKLLTVTILVVTSTLTPCQSDAQNVGWSGKPPSPGDVAQFFQGQISADDAWARYNIPLLHLMGEKPLAEAAEPQAAQVYRLFFQTRPSGIPVVVRLSVGPDGTGEVVSKISQSARAADVLAVHRTVNLSRTEVGDFYKLLADSGFWSMPVHEQINIHHVLMGETGWIFEGKKEGSYHVVCRGTSSLASLKKAVMFLVDVSKLDLASTTIRPDDGRKSTDKSQ